MIHYCQEDLGVIEITCKSLSIRKYSKSEALAKDKINEKERKLLSNFYIGVFYTLSGMYIFSAGQRYIDSSIDELTINILNGCTFTIMLGTIIHCITADGNIKWPRLVSATPEIQTRWKRFSWVLSLPTFTRAPTVCRNQSACLSASSPADRPPGSQL